MREAYPELNVTALALRNEFDLAFTKKPDIRTANLENFLGFRLGDDAYALRTSEIAGLHADCRIMPLPTPVATLLGVAAFRGLIAPVYNLAELLGYTCKTQPRWLVLLRMGDPVALAFETFDAHFSADPSNIVKAYQLDASAPAGARAHLYDAVRSSDTTRPIIRLKSLIESIQGSVAQPIRQRSNQS